MIKKLLLIIGIINQTSFGFTQINIPTFGTPQPANFTNYSNGYQPGLSQKVNPLDYMRQQEQLRIQQQNQQIMQKVQKNEQNRQQQINSVYKELNEYSNNSISYSLSSFSGEAGTENFRNAFVQINEMLQGKQTLDLKKAVFLTENAYVGNTMKYEQFDSRIKKDVQSTKLLIKQKNYKVNENLTKNLALFQYMCDTTKFYKGSTEGFETHLPYTYDFNDFFGKEDWSKMFVSKLMVSKSGQCHSLPLLYLIYAQEIGTEAYLAYSPSHSYVKFHDKENNWYNLELTNGMLISDAAIIASGYIKTEAIKNKIYMDTISTKQAVATCLTDLAQGYYRKHGYDDFMLKCADTVLKYSKNNFGALQLKSDYYTVLFHHVGKQLPPIKTQAEIEPMLEKYPKAKEIRDLRNKMYETIDNSGYEEMPEAEYQKWLNSVSKQANKQENKAKILYIQNKVK